MMNTETFPNEPPPGYQLVGSGWGNPQVQRAGSPPVTLIEAWRAHRASAVDPRDVPTVPGGEPSGYMCECGSPICKNDAHMLVPIADADAAHDRRGRIVEHIVSRLPCPAFFEPGGPVMRPTPRGWTVQTLAACLEVDRKTLTSWLRDADMLERALKVLPGTPARVHRSLEFLERVVCVMARGPVLPKRLTVAPPAMPAALRWSRAVGLAPELVVRGPAATLSQVTTWAEGQGAEIVGNNVRAALRGPEPLLIDLREGLLAFERWLTLTPTTADVDTWLAAEVP